MRAYQVVEHGPPRSLRCSVVTSPSPDDGQVLIDVRAAGINYPDVLVVSGKYQVIPQRPFTPGKDLAGVVLAVGDGVNRVSPGDRVLCHVDNGAFAEQAVVSEQQVFKLPSGLSYTEAAAMGLVYQTAYLALVDRAHLGPEETVLIGGAAGGIGLAAIQLAKGLGATVIPAVRSDDEAALVKRGGADQVVDLSRPGMWDGLREQVHALTGGKGVDVVVDPLGAEFFSAALRSLAWCGRLIVVGFAAGEIPSVRANYLLVKNIAVSGVQWSDYRDRKPERIGEVQRRIFDFWTAGAVKPHIMKEFSFDDLPSALEMIEQGMVRGKAVVVMDG